MNHVVKNIIIGAMSASATMQHPLFREPGNLVITSGDRSDVIVAALGSDSAAVILTNNILPSPNLISRSEELGIPLLLVSTDTYDIAKQIDSMDSLTTRDDLEKIALIENIFRKHIDLTKLNFT